MKIWLDDERDPKDPFIQKEFGASSDMLWVKTAPEAIAYLSTGKVTYISLDHDLCANATGYDVATWIEAQAFAGELPKLNWDVHTQNSVGYQKIVTALANADKYWEDQNGK